MGSGRRQRGGLEHEVIAVLAADGGAMTPVRSEPPSAPGWPTPP